MTKEVLKVEDLEVGAILTNENKFGHHFGDPITFYQIEEVTSEMVYLAELNKKYHQSSSDQACVIPTNEVVVYCKKDIKSALSIYKLYIKYDLYQECRWEIHVGDSLRCHSLDKLYITEKGYDLYYRVKKIYETSVAADVMCEGSTEVYDSCLVRKSELLQNSNRIYNRLVIG